MFQHGALRAPSRTECRTNRCAELEDVLGHRSERTGLGSAPHKQAHLFSRLGRMVGRRDCRVANGKDRSGAPARQVTLSPVDGTALGAAFGSRERINAKAWESVQANCATPFWRRTKRQLRWCSPDNARTSPSSWITCASTVMSWNMTCWPLLTGTFAPPSAPRSVVTFLITPGGRPPPELLLWKPQLSHCSVCRLPRFRALARHAQAPSCAPQWNTARPHWPRCTPS